MKKPLQLLLFPLLHPVQLCRWEWHVSLGQVPKIAGIRLRSADTEAVVSRCMPCLMFSAVPGQTLEVAIVKDTLSTCSLFSTFLLHIVIFIKKTKQNKCTDRHTWKPTVPYLSHLLQPEWKHVHMSHPTETECFSIHTRDEPCTLQKHPTDSRQIQDYYGTFRPQRGLENYPSSGPIVFTNDFSITSLTQVAKGPVIGF